jgi:hypothetical protein
VELFYDERDDPIHEARGSQVLYWLDDLDAKPLSEAHASDNGFLFAGARSIEDYSQLVERFSQITDRPKQREPLLRLDHMLDALGRAGVELPQPRTWRLLLDAPIPADITFPLFVRTAETSWKRGGRIGRVRNAAELEAECAELRRAFGWDALVLAREWLELSPAGEGRHGPVPQEVRVWIVDSQPVAWSFHYMHICSDPRGFPLSEADLCELAVYAKQVGTAFRSRLVVADFARLEAGGWCLIEAGPGSCAGTAHEAVFKFVVGRLRDGSGELKVDRFGGPLPGA